MVCNNHTNGFKHIDIELNGAEIGFDFGIKFIEDPEFSDENYLAPPYLSMYISFYHDEIKCNQKSVLEYCLSRDYWIKSSIFSEIDKENLYNNAKKQIENDMVKILRGETPLALKEKLFIKF